MSSPFGNPIRVIALVHPETMAVATVAVPLVMGERPQDTVYQFERADIRPVIVPPQKKRGKKSEQLAPYLGKARMLSFDEIMAAAQHFDRIEETSNHATAQAQHYIQSVSMPIAA
jgi:hypothetical protein